MHRLFYPHQQNAGTQESRSLFSLVVCGTSGVVHVPRYKQTYEAGKR